MRTILLAKQVHSMEPYVTVHGEIDPFKAQSNHTLLKEPAKTIWATRRTASCDH